MKNKGIIIAGAVVIVAGAAAAMMMTQKKDVVKLNPNKPVILNLWNYYNGKQQESFDEMVKNFNETLGKEKGIIVTTRSSGGVNQLITDIMASANHEVGAEELPDMCGAYADTAYVLDQKGLVVNLSDYMTKEEIDEYVPSYIEEGCFNGDQVLKMMPVAKSTEEFLLNETAWKKFAKETGADKSKLSTWEGLVELAEEYYKWTDDQTPDIPNDGKAFFGRDSFANYMLVGAKQLGKEIFKVENGKAQIQVDKDVMKKLWDCYYVPYVNGWFGEYGRFRSDDIKTGQIIAQVSSSSGALFFPKEVSNDDGTSYPIECGVYQLPNFENKEPYAVQQGAGYIVLKSTKEKEYASTVFLKWVTEKDNDISFSLESGYLPVKKESNDIELLHKIMQENNTPKLQSDCIEMGVQIISDYHLYTTVPFKNANEGRNVVDSSMKKAAAEALAKRDQMIQSGDTREDAVNKLTNDEAFENWYTSFKTEVEDAVLN